VIPLRDNIRSRTFPFVNILLILANISVFVREITFPHPKLLEDFVLAWALIPSQLWAHPLPESVTLVSSMFLHGGWSHILGNMMYLWIFGDNVEDRVGHLRYLLFYVLVGGAAAAAQIYTQPKSQVPMLGASGAIAGILGAYFVLYPGAKVSTLIPLGFFSRIVDVPAFFFLGFWFLIQALQSYGSIISGPVHGNVGGVAWGAHAGGFVAGLVLIWFFKKR
jgi:membrane associated rhomboid family serine protease